ncbi:MAG: VanZ family protein [Clostridiales bacterium]|jgi:glycopeptide antibiotics resistance protein|nr:VanZ family protein [Clostridiales bacterium]
MTKKHTASRRIVIAMFVLYVLAMLFLLVIPNNYRGHNVLVGGFTWERWLAYITRAFNLVPFKGLAGQIRSIIAGEDTVRNIVYMAGNLGGFAPLGFFLPALFAKGRKFKAFLLTVLITVIALELMQLITMRGSFDIDDVILNTGGVYLGFLLFRKAKIPSRLQ